MKIESMRKEIRELRNALVYRTEPACKTFIRGKEESHTETEIEAYKHEHPHTRVIVLTRKSCRKECMG